MGRYDDITPDELRTRLLKFARLVRAMEKRGVLLEKAPSLLRLLGELRQMIFAYEVRSTREFQPPGEDTESGASGGGTVDSGSESGTAADPASHPELDESLRIVREALERDEELQKELRDGFFRKDGDD